MHRSARTNYFAEAFLQLISHIVVTSQALVSMDAMAPLMDLEGFLLWRE